MNVLFDTGCIGNIISLEFWKRVGIKIRVKPECMSVIDNQTLQEGGETIEPVTFSLGFCTERMKFIVSLLGHDFILGKNWKTSIGLQSIAPTIM